MGLPKYILRRLGAPSGMLSSLWAWLFNRSNRRENEEAVRALNLGGDERVLDVGFGGGVSFPHLLSAVPDGSVVGVEPVEEMVERARKKWAREVSAARLEVRVGRASSLGLPETSAQAALTVHTTYFWPDLTEGFDEIRRVLAPGGPLVVVVADPEMLRSLGFEKVGHRIEPPEAYAECLEASGYADVEVERLQSQNSLLIGRSPA